MSPQEILEWIKTAKFITTDYERADSSGNVEMEVIYEKDNKLYRIDFQNGHPYGGLPQEVRHVIETIEVDRYYNVNN